MAFFAPPAAKEASEKKSLGNIDADQVNSNQQALPVKYLAGRRYLAGDYITPAYNEKAEKIESEAGKGSDKTTVGYLYSADFALVFCMGGRRPVDAIYKVIVDSEIVWEGNVIRGAVAYADITVPDHGSLRIYWGSDTQATNTTLLSRRNPTIPGGVDPRDKGTWPKNVTGAAASSDGDSAGDPNPLSGHYDMHPAYRGQCYGVFKNWKLGRDRTQVPNIQVELMRGVPFVGGAELSSDSRGVNPIGVLYDWLTDPRFGVAMPEARLLTASFTAAQISLDNIDIRISPLLTGQESFRSVIAALLGYFDGWLRRNGTQLEVGFWSHGAIKTRLLPVLTDDDLDGDPGLRPTGFGQTVNAVTVIYKDRSHHYNDTPAEYRDSNNRRIVGEPRAKWLHRPWITDADLAQKYAFEYGTMHALPLTAGPLAVKREALTREALLPGMRFKLRSGYYGRDILCRLLEIEWPEDKSGKATLTIEAERGFWPALYVAPALPRDPDFRTGPRAIAKALVYELPYLLKGGSSSIQIAIFAKRPMAEVVGFHVWGSRDNLSYYRVAHHDSFAVSGQLYSNYPITTPNPDTTDGAEVLLFGVDLPTVVAQTIQQRDNASLLMFIGYEVISIGLVQALGSGLYRIFGARYQYGTPALTGLPHPAGSAVWIIPRNKLLRIAHASFVPGTQNWFKLQPYTASQDYDLASITPITYTFGLPGDPPSVSISPASRSFTGSINVTASASALGTPRYTLDGSEPNKRSAAWPGGSGGTLVISQSCVLTVRAFFPDGSFSAKAIANYTQVASGAGDPAAAPVQFAFSGRKGYTGGSLTLSSATAFRTILYSKNGAAYVTYSAAFSIVLGDTVEAYATATGFSGSVHTFFDNGTEGTGGPPADAGVIGGGNRDPV